MLPGRTIATLLFALIGSILFSSWVVAAEAVADPLVVSDCRFGEVYQFSEAGCTATLENKGATPLVLTIIPVQPGNTVEPDKLTLAAHARSDVATHVLTDNIGGNISWTYRIEEAGKDPRFLRASGFVMSALDEARPAINFGSLMVSKEPISKSVTLNSSLYPKLRIAKVVSSPDFLHVKILEDGKTLSSEIRPDAPWGPFDAMVKLAIDTPVQKEAWVQVAGSVDGDIGPKRNPHWIGTLAWQPERTLTVPLIDREARDFTIGAVTSKDFVATYDSAPCDPPQTGCRNLLIHVGASQPAGFFKSDLDVILADRNKHLTLTLWGVIEGPSQVGVLAMPPTLTKIPIPKPKDDKDEPTPPIVVQADPPGAGPLLKWSIAHQDSVYGYQVFRADAPEGPFALVGGTLIPKVDNGKGPVAYRWRDTTAVKGQAYWYYIAVLYVSGDRRALSGAQKSVAN